MGLHIKTDGTVIEVHPAGAEFTGEELREMVGGWLELVRPIVGVHLAAHALGVIEIQTFRSDVVMVDEEGALKHREANELATMICGQPIVGDVVLCRKGEVS